ncbi:MAG: methyl-accepting chemotaxis protein [Shinella sp.]|nr:methyl-accepting chemotaxis protein [Shinella sp.]
MQFLDNAKIRTKIVSVIVLMGLSAIIGLAYVSVQFKAADKRYSDFITHESMAAMLNARATGNLLQMGFQLGLMVVNDPGSAEFAAAEKKYDADRVQLKERLRTTAELVAARAEPVASMIKGVEGIEALGAQVVTLAKAGSREEATGVMKLAGAEVMNLLPQFATGNDQLIKVMETGSAELQAETNATILISLSALGLALVAVVVLGFYVSSRGITAPINRLRERMVSLASGDTSGDMPGLGRKDEVGQMAAAVAVFRDNAIERDRLEREANDGRTLSAREAQAREAAKAKDAADTQAAVEALAYGLSRLSAGDVAYRIEEIFVEHLDSLRENFNASMQKLQEALGAVGDNAKVINSGASEIRSAADDLSRRTEQQAASLEETAAALEQITTTVRDSTRRAEEVGVLVERTRVGAEKSGEVVRKAVTAMNEIEKSSGEIGNIIGVIDDIAFQTNLLALNAGVEAARAGDAGKGFAVVAQEVRELAQRSANAAKEIKVLISTSGNHVRAGVDLVGETGKALVLIEKEVTEITSHVRAIVEAAREQSTGIQEINTAVNTMDQGTQQNAAMVEQTNAASHSLAKEAASLNGLLGQFNIGDADAPKARARIGSATPASRPVASPARALTSRLANTFSAGQTAAALAQDNWEEF